jgi:hypothetical protein
LRPHISFSEISSFAQGCQWKWKLDYLENRRSRDYSPDLDFGTAIHDALEQYHRRKNPVSLAEAKKLFSDSWKKLTDENSSKYPKQFLPKDFESMLASGNTILDCYVAFINTTPELQESEVVHNEFELFEPIAREDNLDIKFKGYIDIIIKSKDKRGKPVIWVCDFKTCSWGWSVEKRTDPWRLNQLFLYKYYLCKKFNMDPKQVRAAFILLKKSPSKGSPPIEFLPVSAGPVSVQRALDTKGSIITEMLEKSRSGQFHKDRSKCEEWGRRCPYLDSELCPND